jgi:hypothetical protein
MSIDSNKFYSVRLEVDIVVMKSLYDEVTEPDLTHLTCVALAGITSGSSQGPAPPSQARPLTAPPRLGHGHRNDRWYSGIAGNFIITY